MNIFYRVGGFTNIEFEKYKIENRAIFHYHQHNPETISDNNYERCNKKRLYKTN
jgi:hypothetical protein